MTTNRPHMQSRHTSPDSIRNALESAANDLSLRAKMAIVRANFELIEELREKDVLYRHIHARLVEATGVDIDLDTFVTYVWRERRARASAAPKKDKPGWMPSAVAVPPALPTATAAPNDIQPKPVVAPANGGKPPGISPAAWTAMQAADRQRKR